MLQLKLIVINESAFRGEQKQGVAASVDSEIQGAYRRLAHARRLRQSAEKLLAIAAARCEARRGGHRRSY
ncbi:MAG TPA: hypothetical protein VMU80_24310 [Bryobacteraceae bacterium]|nr:hypothetical protein [Bryobacteraceae bacterium]